MRIDYGHRTFDTGDLAPTWHDQLDAWLEAAAGAGVVDPNAMVLATADASGEPTSRTVLCKGISADGVDFYTHLTSPKSRAVLDNARACATFPWYPLSRQVHVRGRVEPIAAAEVERYWDSRPRGSQIGAWASPQSTDVADRRSLDEAQSSATQRFREEARIPLPPHWGGWRIVPREVEFWQGRSDRMHDRLCFRRRDDAWSVVRLAP